jgi:YebC/PmpR family DNA-binding regulatory protein
MSGHSKWSNIKNRKGAQDKKRSETFTKISKNILTALRTGEGLKTAIEKAKGVNMPKENIDRLIRHFEERKANLIPVIIEGYGPFGVPMVVESETDNKNRILSEIKLIFRNYGGNLGESNSVMFQFRRVGEVELDINIPEDKELDLIDAGAIEFEEKVILVEPDNLNNFKKRVEEMGLKVAKFESSLRSNNPIILKSEEEVSKIMDMIEELEENDDVINVFAGFDYRLV